MRSRSSSAVYLRSWSEDIFLLIPVSDFLHITWGVKSNKCYKDAMYQKINAILARKDIIFIDPYDEEPFQYPSDPTFRVSSRSHAQHNSSHQHLSLQMARNQNQNNSTLTEYGRLKPPATEGRKRAALKDSQNNYKQLQAARSVAPFVALMPKYSRSCRPSAPPSGAQSKEASKARLDQLFEDVDDATMDRLMVQA